MFTSYVRPYTFLATHIKTHAIHLDEFQALYRTDMTPALWTEYYDGNKIYAVIQNRDRRELTYRQLLKQSITDLGNNQERVDEEASPLPVLAFQNKTEHQHIRQKIALSSLGLTLEIFLHKVHAIDALWTALPGYLTDLVAGQLPVEILSLSYRHHNVVLKTKSPKKEEQQNEIYK